MSAPRQRERLGDGELAGQLRYWEERLAGVPLLDLPTDRPRPAARRGRAGVHRFEIGVDLVDRLRALAWEADATLFVTLLASYATLLGRFSGQRDFAIGTPAESRPRPELDGLSGFVDNTLALRCNLEGDPSFHEFLGRVRDEALAAGQNQDIPFERLVEDLCLDQDRSRTPVFQAVLEVNDWEEDAPPGGLSGESLRLGGAKTDLTLVLNERGDGSLEGLLEYDEDLFEAATARRVASHLGRLLEAIVADPDLALDELEVLPGPERGRILGDFNRTAAPYPDLCLNELVEQQVERTPDAIAIRAGSQTLTYRELDRRANRIAHRLRGEGAGPEVAVGACVAHGPHLLPALLGILKAGSHYVPLDASAPGERTQRILEDAGVALILAEEGPAAALPATEAKVIDVAAAALGEGPDQRPVPLADPGNLVYVIYTSGSTGRPKGVMISHRALNNYLLWAIDGYGLDGERGAPMVGSISFDLSIPNLFLPLLGGKDVTFFPEDGALDSLTAALLEEEVDFSLLKLTPSHLDLLRAVLPSQARLSSVRTYVVGADEVKADTVAAWRRLAPTARIIDEYGPTETVVGCSIYEVAPDDGLDRPVPIGKPIANTDMFVLDRFLRPVPVGVRGELYIGGAGVARGYNRLPRVTAERFVPHPYATAPGSRLYRTGDLARFRENGDLEFLGRIDNQVKIRAYRVEPGEVEACLLVHPGVREAAVVAVTGRGPTRLRACVVGAAEAPPDESSLRSHLRSRLPAYMVPQEFAFFDSLPLDSARKLDRAALAAQAPQA